MKETVNIIEIKNLSFTYHGQQEKVLDDLSLEIQDGSIFGLIGKNGAGKTTFFQLLLGILKPDTGSIQIGRFDNRTGVGWSKVKNVKRRQIGFVPERPYYHKNFRFKEYLFFLNQMSEQRKTEEEVVDLIRFVHLENEQDEYIRNFSKGMLQRIGIAQALLNEPELLILDEPMSGLDVIGQDLMRDLILRIHARGTTVLISSHNLYEMERICDSIGLLYDRKLQMINQSLLERKRQYQISLGEMDTGALKKLQNYFSRTEKIDIKDGELILSTEDQESYFQVMDYLTKQRIRISNLTLKGLSLEKLILDYLTHGGDFNE